MSCKQPIGVDITIKDLSFEYDKTHPVLDGINLEIKAGEKFGIIGPTGAGKSTLLLHLNSILQPTAGEMLIDNLPVNKENLPKIRKLVGLVFQNPDDQLFNPTVEEDIAFGPLNFGHTPEEAATHVQEAIEALNLQGFEKESSHHLSFGERKRVALATVLALEPEVVAFDEPFSNLDPAMVGAVVDIIKNMTATVVVISQAILPAFACCDRIGVLVDGKMIKTGTVKEIANDKKLLRDCGLDIDVYCNICKRLK